MSSTSATAGSAVLSVILGGGSAAGISSVNQSALEGEITQCRMDIQSIQADYKYLIRDLERIGDDVKQLGVFAPRAKLEKRKK